MKTLIFLLIGSVNIFAQSGMYPLHIGDTWQYMYSPNPPYIDSTIYSYQVGSDTVINGKSYMIIIPKSYYQTKNFIRQSGDSVIYYRDSSEIVYYDFSKSIGDTISTSFRGNDTMDIVLIDTYMAEYFGISRKVWVFGVNQARQSVDDEYSVSVADSLGIVQINPSFGDRQVLVGAKINGIIYGKVTEVSRNINNVPNQFNLYQNYPNPFNPATTIRFSLNISSNVSIDIYNNIGQVIQVYNYGLMASGEHEMHFNASHLPSGVYYYRLNTSIGYKTMKMLLEK